MSEVTDVVVPMLQKIQADIAEMKRDVATMKAAQAEHSEKLDDVEIHLAYLTGRESQNTFDLSKLRQQVRKAEERIASLEPHT